ncbi:GNAT family N-acetyltransferase [Phytoactinopolyspora sp. XMNu-373]|uniref:GNAT family N-acetyltransferase n=2 Tax=Phytoactinopolyspora mesophila TaxID=2650750 RepID=A0A7K3M907_9ACTN|nr:GNAT family N-acetyltransferase [Phytoactinopolyspora mesophila]
MTVNVPDAAEIAHDTARSAAQHSGVVVRDLREMSELQAVAKLFHSVWQPDESSPLVTIEQLRALTHSGNYLAGAFDGGLLVGACVGFFAAPAGSSLHSHIAGVSGGMRGRSVGFALKLHQRAWALERGLAEITWTFDPLVRRNAYFNLVKLGARPREYLVDFYGDIPDAVNAGQGSDRLLVAWELMDPVVVASCDGSRTEADAEQLKAAGAVLALAETDSGLPEASPVVARDRAAQLLVQVPGDIETMRMHAPGLAKQWRLAVREVLGDLIAGGARVSGFSRTGYYVVERTAS